jgi:hypothetical protein
MTIQKQDVLLIGGGLLRNVRAFTHPTLGLTFALAMSHLSRSLAEVDRNTGSEHKRGAVA